MRFSHTMLFLALIALGNLLVTSCKKTDVPGPHIDNISPTSGLGGNLVTITGAGFDAVPSADIVTFNGIPAEVISATGKQLLVLVPNSATTGAVSVTVSGKLAKGPDYTVSSISIAAISPNTGAPGQRVTITGSGLINTGKLGNRADVPWVFFNGRQAVVDSVSATVLVVTVPDSAGYGPVSIELDSSKVSGPVFYYVGIVSASPLSGNVGTVVTLKGGFGQNPNQDVVTFNGKTASIISATPAQLVVGVPQGGNTGRMLVGVGSQSLTGPIFTFVPPPQLTQLLPSSGPAGTKVAISGVNFSKVPAEDTVRFNGVLASVVGATATQLMVIAPAGAGNGPVSVLVNGQPSSQTLPYKYQALGISAINPVAAIPPAPDTLHGFGFGTIASSVTVQFNGVTVPIVSIADTQIVVSVPTAVSSGLVTIQVGSLTANGPYFSTAGVGTFAGGTYGLANGQGLNAQFRTPAGIAIDASGNVYVADLGGNNIRKITPDGTVSNFAGDPNGGSGNTDGQGASARFNGPNDLCFDKSGNLYVADQNNEAVRKITPDGTVSTLVAKLPHNSQPWGVAVDPQGNVWASDWSGSYDNDYQFDPATGNLLQTLTMNAGARLDGIAIDAQGNVYTIDRRYNGLFKNTTVEQTNYSQYYDKGVCIDNNGNIIVIDGGWNRISLVDPTTFITTVLTGGGGNGGTSSGFKDGPLSTALFNNPIGAKVDAQGNVYVADQNNHAIRVVKLK